MKNKKYNILNRKALSLRVRMSTDMANKIIKYSEAYYMTKSAFIRMAVNKLITEIELVNK